MTSFRRLSALECEGELLVAAAGAAGMSSAVPTCPGWTVADLLRHVGLVHRWATAVVEAAGPPVDQDEFDQGVKVPRKAKLTDWVAYGHVALLDALSRLPVDYDGWVLLPSPLSAHDFWTRRQLHETAIHRIDAELAAGAPVTAVGAPTAADGIDELLGVLAPAGPLRSPVPVTLGVEPTDIDRAWTLTISDDPPAVVRQRQPADCTLTGTADELYAYLWNRSDDGVEVSGESELTGLWREVVRISR